MQITRPSGFRKRSYLLLIIFVLTGAILYSVHHEEKASRNTSTKPLDIQENIPGWVGTDVPLDMNALNLIRPDAMIFRNYRNQAGEVVNLYIGFYNTMDKSDLAHSPLVCYPGQGWRVKQGDVKEVRFVGLPASIQVSPLTIEKDKDTELVWYWFQTRDYSTASLGKMRMTLLWNKLSGRSTPNCFARISVTINHGRFSEGERQLKTFMEVIYPQIYEYLKNR